MNVRHADLPAGLLGYLWLGAATGLLSGGAWLAEFRDVHFITITPGRHGSGHALSGAPAAVCIILALGLGLALAGYGVYLAWQLRRIRR